MSPRTSSPGKALSNRESDQLLVERAQLGDLRAFDVLVLKYQRKLLWMLSRYFHDAAEAEDVAQDAFIQAYRSLTGFRGDSAFYTWLFRIASNTAKNHLTVKKRRIPSLANFISNQYSDDADVRDEVQDSATPENALMTKQLGAAVNRAIDALSEDLRTALVLREIDGQTYEAIALATHSPIGTVRSRIFRARESVSLKLRPLLPTQGCQRW